MTAYVLSETRLNSLLNVDGRSELKQLKKKMNYILCFKEITIKLDINKIYLYFIAAKTCTLVFIHV